MMIHRFVPIAAPLLLGAAIAAQTPIYTLPKAAHNAWGTNPSTVAPPIPKRFRSQNWYRGDNLPQGFVIHAVALRRSRFASAAYTADYRITLDNSTLGYGQLSQTLANNLGPGAAVRFAGSVSIPASGPATSPFQEVKFFTLSPPFVFRGPHLIVDFDVTNIQARGPLLIDFVSMCNSSQTVHLTNTAACGAELAGQHLQGQFAVFNMTPVPALQPVFFLIGVENVAFGALSFPADLTSIGLPGCTLGIMPLTTVTRMSDAQGQVALTAPFNLRSTSATVSVQAVHPMPGTALGLATTNTVNSILGNQGAFRGLVSRNGATAAPPNPCNSAPVLLLK